MHKLYIFRSKSPISLRLKIAQIKIVLLFSKNGSDSSGDLTGDKGFSTTGTFMVKEDAVADSTKAKKNLGWQPKIKFKELVRIMVDADM
ncbi:unnamed protein product [marine sediment metagenome]|uniref:NAD(P)-binding domain-containing protein n=1 Tax=marine sediment metagenome TaxID=412755 RepID=X1PE36_9ZZZZ